MTISLEDPKVWKVAAVKCLRSIEFHTRYFFFTHNKKKFISSEHHRIICEALDRVLRGELKRLIISMPPRYGKTELAVKSFVSNGLALNAAAKFIHLSYGDDIALDNSEAIKDLISSEEYQNLFPGVQIKKDAKAKNKWYTTQGGGLLARAAGGQVTGFGAGEVDVEDDIDAFWNETENERVGIGRKLKFAGAIIIDDPIKPEDADMDTMREKVNSRFDSTIRTRANSRNTPIVVIMHRLHPNDLSGYLQREDEADKWEVISLPALIRDEVRGEDTVEIEYTDDGEHKEVVTKYRALWPHKHTVAELIALKKANELVFERQYQQDPSPKTGLLFPLAALHFYLPTERNEELDDADFVLVCADPADEGGDDFAGGTFKLLGDKIYVTSILYNTDGADFNEASLSKMIMGQRTSDVAVEGVLGWKETAVRIRQEIVDAGYENEFRVVRPRTKKHSRILNRASFIKNHFVFRADWRIMPQYSKFMRNLTSYLRIQEPGKMNKHDDAPDLCEMAGAYFEKNFVHLWGRTGTRDPKK